MPLIKDLISIPEKVHQGDFVLQLSKGVTDAEQTLRDYVVTPQLVDAFDNALGFVQQAVLSGSSKAAYLHGSFGSGKSHFMAVLNLLLAGNTQARATPELADVVARHAWTAGRRFLLVPYHMIGATDMESAILGGYAEFVRRVHPEAPVPGFYLAEDLFRDARELRSRMGDEAFFGKLNEGGQGGQAGGGWGDIEGGWEAASFDAALLEPPNGEERARLVGDLIRQYFSAYRALAGSGESFVSLDAGLSILSRHAQALGYDAVILFLDELVLWLASRAGDVSFVSREGTKLVKLVEATHADRPVPLVSFVARQRDLRDLVGENLAGAVQLQFSDVLRHWEARFHRITLEDRNLPAIAEKRVLRPVSEAARATLQAACDDVLRMRADTLGTLLTSTGEREMFRKVYPFSPVLVQTLIAVSAALQRERTALKLMLQLLVDRRGDLELGQVIPVGDLWDAIAEGDEPFSEGMRLHFENAKRLYGQRLLPMLERQHGVTWEAIRLGQADGPAARNLRNDARLLKTLLLGALVPEVESLKGLTAQRLAALNHGTFRSPIPGREVQDVFRKCRDWAAEVGEIKLTPEDLNSVISIQVTGVDIEPILRAAEGTVDNLGNRRRRIRETLFEQLGITDGTSLFTSYAFTWRGTPREVNVVFENVREMSDERLRSRDGSWTVVLDFPFDEPGFGPQDDGARLDGWRGGDTATLVWLPSFLGPRALSELGRLVVLEHILQGERFDDFASHLNFVDRVQAKALAKNQRDQLRGKLRSQLDAAYGISNELRDALVAPLTADQQFRSLDATFAPRPPVGADFRAAFESLLAQLLRHQYPAHPEFGQEVRAPLVRKVWPEVLKAIEAPDRRSLVADNAVRKQIRAVVDPLQLGRMGETHLLVEPHWVTRFTQAHAREGGRLTVARLRQWIDEPQAMGLPLELQNLLILAFAALTNRRFTLNGGPAEPTVDSLGDALELVEQALPEAARWQGAVQRAAALFGLTLPQSLNAANVARLIDEVRREALGRRESVARLAGAVKNRCQRYADGSPSARLRSAASAQELLGAMARAENLAVVDALATAALETSEAAVSRTLGQAQAVAAAIEAANWPLFDALRDIGATDPRRAQAEALLQRLVEGLQADEHVVPLAARLRELQGDAVRLFTVAPPPPPVPPPAPLPEDRPVPPPVDEATEVVEERQQQLRGAEATRVLQDLRARLERDAELELVLSWRLQRRKAGR